MARKPTRKQKKAVKILVENGGIGISRAMIQAGYSPATAQTPQKLTESKGFQELVDEVMPDKDLLRLHKEGLEATMVKTATFEGSISDEKEYADYPTRHRYLETAYQIKGYLDQNKSDTPGDITINLAVYGKQDDRHTVSIPAKTIPATIPGSNGRGVQASGDSVAPSQREGQDSTSGSD